MKSTKFYLDVVTEKKLSLCQFYCPVDRATTVLAHTYAPNDIIVLHTFIDYNIIFQFNRFDNFQFNHMWCAYFDKNMKKCEGNFIETLNHFTSKKMVIIVYIDFYNYLIDTEHLEKKNIITYNAHSSVSIYYPVKTEYNIFHFNSHGCATTLNKCYHKYITRTRCKIIPLNQPVDHYVYTQFISTVNKHPTTKIHYQYESTAKFNYLGPNLQYSDCSGICFTFPFLICRNFIMNYRCSSTIPLPENMGTIRMQSTYTNLKTGLLNTFIYRTMNVYIKEFANLLIPHAEIDLTFEDIHESIRSKGRNMLRAILHDFIRFTND